ncbi:MAG: MATE family efflux transporter [Lachnospiraceae bacterium]|nr:MATE family efflux transporter [Lachnospiraceae bacterium]
MANQLDMTKGKPFGLIVKFIIPVVLGNIFQQLYNMVDTIIVGRFVGLDALAAVGATGTISFLILGFALGLTSGFTVLTAQRFGAGDEKGLKLSVTNAIVLSFAAAVILTIISTAGMKKLLVIMHTPENIFQMSYDYIIIICTGMIFTIFYNVMASLLRAVGNSRAPLYFLIISALLNIVLDLVLIKNFGMGVKGAAYATIISQGISGILCFFYTLNKVKLLVPDKETMRIDGMCMRNQLSIGIPMALQFSITAVGTIMVQTALNKFGSVVVASYTAANKAGQLATLPYSAMGVAMSTYSAQNRGINDIGRIKKGTLVSSIMSIVYSIAIYGVAILTLPVLMRLFVDTGSDVPFEQILEYGRTYILISGICYIPLGEIFIYRNVMQGCGFSLMAMIGGIVELISRAIVSTVASAHQSFAGVCAADPVTWLVTAIFLMISYKFTVLKMDKDKKEFHAKKSRALAKAANPSEGRPDSDEIR